MRVAIFSPGFDRTNDLIEKNIKWLAEGLSRQPDFEVRLFSPAPDAGGATANALTETTRLAQFMGEAQNFDLLHNCAGTGPVAFSRLSETPMITTLFETPQSEEIELLQQNAGRGYYVRATSDGGPLEYAAQIAFVENESAAPEMVQAYAELYRRIYQNTCREDHRPWGYYVILADTADHKVKRIVVYPGKRLSYQRHSRRAEHWYVLEGQARVTLDDKPIDLGPGQAVDIAAGAKHRIENPGDTDMAFIEVQTGDYFGEDDIERFEDDFGRS